MDVTEHHVYVCTLVNLSKYLVFAFENNWYERTECTTVHRIAYLDAFKEDGAQDNAMQQATTNSTQHN